jgi:RNA polymerase sigma-70 factor, ECF subfamily
VRETTAWSKDVQLAVVILPGNQLGELQYEPGSVEDFDRLYRSSFSRILYTIYAIVGDRAAAEDCTHDAFVRAFKAWKTWKPDAPAEAWLHRIAINVAYNHIRQRKLRDVGELVRRLGRPESGKDPTEVAEDSELFRALRRLHPDQAAVIVLRHHHGYSNREIAFALGSPESTIASRLAKAKERLREELKWSPDPARPTTRFVRQGEAGVVPIDGRIR